jgi:phage shock protein E
MNGNVRQHPNKVFGASASRRTAMRGLGGVGIGALVLLGSSRRATAHGAEDVAAEAMEAIAQALVNGDASGLDAVFAADVAVQPRHRMLATGEEVSPDLAGLKVALEDMRSVVSDIELTVEDVIAEEEKAAGRFSYRGTIAASGQSLEGSGLVFVVVADDLVTELWAYLDPYSTMAVMATVGIATPAAAASETAAREVAVAGAGTYFDVDPSGLAAMLPEKTFPLINVHVPYEGEIEGTDLFIPFDQIEQHLDQLPGDPGARIVLYCRTGRMSAIAAETLVARGYTDVWNLAGGMVGWEQAGYPLVFAEQ